VLTRTIKVSCIVTVFASRKLSGRSVTVISFIMKPAPGHPQLLAIKFLHRDYYLTKAPLPCPVTAPGNMPPLPCSVKLHRMKQSGSYFSCLNFNEGGSLMKPPSKKLLSSFHSFLLNRIEHT